MSRSVLTASVPEQIDGIIEESGQYMTLKVPLNWYCNLSAGADGVIPGDKLKDEKGLAYGFAKKHGVVLKKYDDYGLQFYCTLCKKWWNGGEHVTPSGKHLAYAANWTDAAITKHTYIEWKNLFNFLYPSTLALQLCDSNGTIAYPPVITEGLVGKKTPARSKKGIDQDVNRKDELDQLILITNELKERVSALERSNYYDDRDDRSDRAYHAVCKGRHGCGHEGYHAYGTGYTKYDGDNSWGSNYGYKGRRSGTYYYKPYDDCSY